MISSIILGTLGIICLIFCILFLNSKIQSGKTNSKLMSITLLIIAGIFLFGAYANHIN